MPTASTSVLGGVKIDNSTITITDGVISAVTGGSGDVTGPAGATADDIVIFNSTTGKIIKDSGKKLSDYQDTLVSGTNIKTVNSTDLLGSGNIVISDGTDGQEVLLQKSATHIQWKYTDDVSWTDLIAIADLVGATGATGAAGSNGTNGTDGIDGVDGTDAAEITSAAFDGNNIKFTKDDATTFSITDAKITLKGEKGDTGLTGATGSTGATGPAGTNGTNGVDGADGTDGLTTSVNGVTQVAGAITIDPDDLDDTSTSHKFVTATDLTNLSNLSGTNSGDQTLPVKASGAINAGRAKFNK